MLSADDARLKTRTALIGLKKDQLKGVESKILERIRDGRSTYEFFDLLYPETISELKNHGYTVD